MAGPEKGLRIMRDIAAAKNWPEKSALLENLAPELAALPIMAADEQKELCLFSVRHVLETVKHTWAAVRERRDSLAGVFRGARDDSQGVLSVGA